MKYIAITAAGAGSMLRVRRLIFQGPEDLFRPGDFAMDGDGNCWAIVEAIGDGADDSIAEFIEAILNDMESGGKPS